MERVRKVVRIKEGSFIAPEKVQSVTIGKNRIKLSKKELAIMNKYCFSIDLK